MASLDPLKSVISINNVDDTSLALPSVNQYESAQQRVLEQVQTIRRTKSRNFSSRSGSASLSPTSPVHDMFDGFSPPTSPTSGSMFIRNGYSQAVINNAKGSSLKRNTITSSYHYEKSLGASGSTAARRTLSSRSEPDLAWQRSLPPQRLLSNVGTYRAQRSRSQYIKGTTSQPLPHPQTINVNYPQIQTPIQTPDVNGTGLTKSQTKFVGSKLGLQPPISKSEGGQQRKVHPGSNGNTGADISLKDAVEYLSIGDETFQHCGASCIQHYTFIDDKAKDEVVKLNGVAPLVKLLQSPSVQVSQTASAALRNLSFKSSSSKKEMHRQGAITEAVALLRETDSVEILQQLTGVLWNLSSEESLKPDLLQSALPVLMERVILPHTTGPDRTNSDPEAFFHATGCLRNISSAKQNNRQAMRKCRGLIDSLVSYVKGCVDAEKPDDKSVENCTCILHNLTFQLEEEAPALFSRITALAKKMNKNQTPGDVGPIGCFSSQANSAAQERHFDFPVVEDPHPEGAGWLFHSTTLQCYLSLLATSEQEETQEACCGAMQNLTAQEGIVSNVMSTIIVQKLNGLKVITPLLKSNKVNLQRSTVALVGNLTKNPCVCNALARKALPELVSIISEGTKGGNESDDTLAMACQVSNLLLMTYPETGKHLLNNKLIKSLNELSQKGYLPKSQKAAAVFLYNLWAEKDLQSFLKMQGMTKATFVNDVTTAAHKLVQIVD